MLRNVCENNVESNGTNVQTRELQAVIDSLKDTGGVVYFPRGTYVTGTLKLYSDITLYLDNGARLLGSLEAGDYEGDYEGSVESPSFSRCLIYAKDCDNITITGNGSIDGRGAAFQDGRPMLMRFIQCRNMEFEKIHMAGAGSWGVHFISCTDIRIHKVTMENRGNSNNDGFDFDSCRNVFLSDTRISSDDDAICLKSTTDVPGENFVITNCILSSATAAFKLGTSSLSGFRNITMSNCIFTDCPMGTIKLITVDGGVLERVTISNIVMDRVGSPLFIRTGKRNRRYDTPAEMDYTTAGAVNEEKPGVIRDIMISDIQANVTVESRDRTPIMIAGLKDSPVENVVLRNIKVSYPGGGTLEEAERRVPEDEFRYPEQWFFGVLPAWGLYARHTKNLTLTDVELKLRGQDEREKMILENCK